MPGPTESYKKRVKEAFSKKADAYDSHAGLQAYAAELCADMLAKLEGTSALAEGDLLEIGCGTGLFTGKLIKLFPERKIICSDISKEMIAACKLRIENSSCKQAIDNMEFRLIDAEEIQDKSKYGLIVSNFAIQWFFQPLEGLTRLLEALKPGGILLFSVPGDESCPEWKQAANRLGLPFTRNPLPSLIQLQSLALRQGHEFRLQHRLVEETHADALSMLRALKELGAGTQRNNLKLSLLELRRLIDELDRKSKPLKLSYQVITAYFRR